MVLVGYGGCNLPAEDYQDKRLENDLERVRGAVELNPIKVATQVEKGRRI
jgi:hypothetical protein